MKFFSRKDMFSRKQIKKTYEHLPPYVVDFVYESFALGALGCLSIVGTDQFEEAVNLYSEFMKELERLEKEVYSGNGTALKEQYMRQELQAILDAEQQDA